MQIKVTTESLDRLPHECLVLGFFSDERPPRGNGGFVDWRLNGLVSRLIADGKIRGDFAERVLIETHSRIPPQKIVLYGLGKRRELSYQTLREAGAGMTETAVRIHCYDFAIEVPGAGRSLLEVAEMTTSFTTGMFDYLSGNVEHLSTVTPCLLSDETYFQKTLLGIHKLRLNVKDKVQIDIRIQRDEQELSMEASLGD
jgi:hypothetical protein